MDVEKPGPELIAVVQVRDGESLNASVRLCGFERFRRENR